MNETLAAKLERLGQDDDHGWPGCAPVGEGRPAPGRLSSRPVETASVVLRADERRKICTG